MPLTHVVAYVDTLHMLAVGRQMQQVWAMATPISIPPFLFDGDKLGETLATNAWCIGDIRCIRVHSFVSTTLRIWS